MEHPGWPDVAAWYDGLLRSGAPRTSSRPVYAEIPVILALRATLGRG